MPIAVIIRLLWICGCLGLLSSVADSDQVTLERAEDKDAFTFVRIKYDSSGGYGESWYRHEGRSWQRWETDNPRAEKNLIMRLQELTSMRVRAEPIVLALTEKELFDHPFIFMSDVGWQVLSAAEQKSLARYLDAGGFLWIDDFWGDADRDNFMRNMGSLNPAWQWRTIPEKHPIFTIVYTLKECPQIPARIFFEQTGLAWDPPGAHRYPSGGATGVNSVHFLGLFDPNDRLMAVATHNTDIADGWEREGENEWYFHQFSEKSAYPLGINIVFYAMTH